MGTESLLLLPDRREEDIERRLFHVYDFATQIIASERGSPVDRHMDVGTYNGFALHKLANISRQVHSFDIDWGKLNLAKHRWDVAPLVAHEHAFLYQMNAVSLGFGDDVFDSASIVEVFGAGFEGGMDDVEAVFRGVHRALKPGGLVVFTVKSRTMEEILKTVGTFDRKGVTLPRRVLHPMLRPLFGEPRWFGQLVLKRADGGVVIPSAWSPNAYVPRAVDEETEVPIFWIGVCQKPNW